MSANSSLSGRHRKSEYCSLTNVFRFSVYISVAIAAAGTEEGQNISITFLLHIHTELHNPQIKLYFTEGHVSFFSSNPHSTS